MQKSVRGWLVGLLWVIPFSASLYAQPGVAFIENKNQWPDQVDYGLKVAGGNMFLQKGAFSYYFLDQKKLNEIHMFAHHQMDEAGFFDGDYVVEGNHVRVSFEGSNPDAIDEPFGELTTYYNYFLGADDSKWASHAKSYAGVKYSEFYEGIDLNVYSYEGTVKYDFVVAPGVSPSTIQMHYAGMDLLDVEDGAVHASTSILDIWEKAPVAYQVIDGVRVPVSVAFDQQGDMISFCFPDGYHSEYELVIDPILIFSTYSGSQADNWGSTATPGEKGTLYSAGVTNHFVGTTFSGSFPATPGAFQTEYGGLFDIGILKYDSSGQELLYASYLGGDFSESPHSLVVTNDTELLVLGTTSSFNFPTTENAIDRTYNGGVAVNNVVNYDNGSDIFIAKISADGAQLLNSTYLGGSLNDGLNPPTGPLTANYGDELRGDILTDSQGNIYVSSVTASSNFPIQNYAGTRRSEAQATYAGGVTDALLFKLSSGLDEVIWSQFIGGSGADASHTIKLFDNTLYVGGGTSSVDFPMTPDAYQPFQGRVDGWVVSLSALDASVIASTFTGSEAFDQIYFLDLNSDGEVYVYGQTSGSMPTTTGVYFNENSGQFVQKFTSDLSTLIFSTVFGSGRGIPDISPTAFLVNDCNNLYMAGWGGSVNQSHWPQGSTLGMPVTGDAYQATSNGSDFYFMVLTEDASEFLYGTYLGGDQSGTHVDGGTSRFDKSGVVYHAVCAGCAATTMDGNPKSDFPATPGAWSNTNNSGNCNNAAFKFDLALLRARIQTNTVTLDMPGIQEICFGDTLVFQNKSIGGVYFEWDFGDGTLEFNLDGSDRIHYYETPGQYTVSLIAYDQGTCVTEDSTFTTIVVNQAQGFVGEDQEICADSSTELVAGGGSQYDWQEEGGEFQSSLARPTISPPDTTRYSVSVTDINGCIVKDTVLVSVVPGIDVQFEYFKIHDCNSRPDLRVVNLTDRDEVVYFDFGDGITSTGLEETHTYAEDGTYNLSLVAERAFCEYRKLVQLPVYTIKAPNVITPGDTQGKNDTFVIRYGSNTIVEAGVKVSLIVYNRWGGTVYESEDYQNEWDGENVEEGIYFYEASIQGETVCKNWLHIMK